MGLVSLAPDVLAAAGIIMERERKWHSAAGRMTEGVKRLPAAASGCPRP